MKSFLNLVGARLVPALLTAAGIVLVTAGLLSYADPATAGATGGDSAVIGTLAPSEEPSGTVSSPSPQSSDDPSPGATPDASAPASIVPDPSAAPGRAMATRVVVPALKIDLPIVKGNDGYPYCNVAMYYHNGDTEATDGFGQPGEGRATYLYAHARDGMFGPIYHLAIEKKNPRKMLGMVVQVYTSDFKLYLYEIREYRLHVFNLDGPLGADTEQVWLQTSEGPKSKPPLGKTQLIADLISVSDATPADAVPKPKPVKCG
jgi:hypothetical protein